MNYSPKVFIGPMTKNIVDATIEFNNDVGFVASRRQIEFDSGYVNNWSTSTFSSYVCSNSKKIVLERDHAGPGQGLFEDDGYRSLAEDSSFFDIIHIDPWKKYNSYSEGLEATVDMINFCYEKNNNIKYEVGTEEAIRKFEVEELDQFLNDLFNKLGPVFSNIIFVVIQSGTMLTKTNQTGIYDNLKLKEMIQVANKFNIKTKEHNCDYIEDEIIRDKFRLGLDSINIAPEFGLIETQTYIDNIDEKSFDLFWQLCYESGRWKKWVDEKFEPKKQKEELVKICGHYVISNPRFLEISKKYQLDSEIKRRVKNKLSNILNLF